MRKRSNLTSEEKAELREIDNDMLWYDMKYLLGEKDSGEPPEIHIDVDYTVRPFEEVEAEYFELFLKHYIVSDNVIYGERYKLAALVESIS